MLHICRGVGFLFCFISILEFGSQQEVLGCLLALRSGVSLAPGTVGVATIKLGRLHAKQSALPARLSFWPLKTLLKEKGWGEKKKLFPLVVYFPVSYRRNQDLGFRCFATISWGTLGKSPCLMAVLMCKMR